MLYQDPVEKLVDHFTRRIESEHPVWTGETLQRSLPACVVDAVFSIGIRYKAVENILERIDGEFISPDARLSEFVKRVRGVGTDEDIAAKYFKNFNRTSARQGVLKSTAVLKFADALLSVKIDTKEDMKNINALNRAEAIILGLPGQGSGISFDYFCMLAGDRERIKPDRRVIEYLRVQLGCDKGAVNPRYAQVLIREVVREMPESIAGCPVSAGLLDDLMWQPAGKQDT